MAKGHADRVYWMCLLCNHRWDSKFIPQDDEFKRDAIDGDFIHFHPKVKCPKCGTSYNLRHFPLIKPKQGRKDWEAVGNFDPWTDKQITMGG